MSAQVSNGQVICLCCPYYSLAWVVRSRTHSASESVSDLVCRAGIALYVLLGLVSWIKAAGAFGGALLFCSGLLIGLVTLPVALVSCLVL